jgi:YD repeat-containing protein
MFRNYVLNFSSYLMLTVVILLIAHSVTHAGTTTYSYDEQDRLHEVVLENGAHISYGYDKIGNIINKKSVSPTTCPSGGILNCSTGYCEITATQTCASGWILNTSTGTCERKPTCSESDTYDSASDLCLNTSTLCPSGYSYSSSLGACTENPICVGGTYNATNKRCEASGTSSCSDSSYSYNSTRGRCEKAPVCPSGMTYNSTSDECTLAFNKTCPSGYTYNSTRARCELNPPQCSQGTFNPTGNKCEWTTTGTYAATPMTSGGVNYDIPVYSWGTIVALAPGTLLGYIASSPFSSSTPSYVIGSRSYFYNGAVGSVVGYMSTTAFSGSLGVYSGYRNYLYTRSGEGPLYGYIATTQGVNGGTTTYTCPSGGTLSGTNCTLATLNQINPTCTNGSLDSANHLCYASYTPTCSQGTYDSTSGFCITSAQCSNGSLDGTTDVCYQAATSGCSSGYLPSNRICIATPTCDIGGSYNSSIGYCSASANSCPSGYSFNSTAGVCYQSANCYGGGLNTSRDVCTIAYSLICPSGYTLNGSTCQLAQSCSSGGQ